jgi:hypothetical protein
MALTSPQKHKVVFYLGWSGQTLVVGSTQFNSVVNDRLTTNLNADIEKLVVDLLAKLEKYDVALEAARCRLATKSIDKIEMNPEEIRMLRSERKRCIRELSDHLDIPITKSSSGMHGVVV